MPLGAADGAAGVVGLGTTGSGELPAHPATADATSTNKPSAIDVLPMRAILGDRRHPALA